MKPVLKKSNKFDNCQWKPTILAALFFLHLPVQFTSAQDVSEAMKSNWVSCQIAATNDEVVTEVIYYLAAVQSDGIAIYRSLSVRSNEVVVNANGTVIKGPASCIGKRPSELIAK